MLHSSAMLSQKRLVIQLFSWPQILALELPANPCMWIAATTSWGFELHVPRLGVLGLYSDRSGHSRGRGLVRLPQSYDQQISHARHHFVRCERGLADCDDVEKYAASKLEPIS